MQEYACQISHYFTVHPSPYSLGATPRLCDIYEKNFNEFFLGGTDKISGGKCKVSWDLVYTLTAFGSGLDILNMGKFARALRKSNH